MDSSVIVIKVKYGGTLRRFNVNLNAADQLDLDFEGLKAKICSLFNFRSDEEVTLSYLDEDDEVVALMDDDDVRDVVRQDLNPVRIYVLLNAGGTERPSSRSSAYRSPNHSSGVADLLKSVPEPFRDPLKTLSLEIASKATSSAPPVLAELVDALTKMGQAVLNSQKTSQPAPTVSRPCSESAESDLESSASEAVKETQIKVDGLVPSSVGTQQSQPDKGTSVITSRVAVPEKSIGNCASDDNKQKSTARLETSGVIASNSPSGDVKEAVNSLPKKSADVSMGNFNPFAMPYVPPSSLFQPANLGGIFNRSNNSRVQGAAFHSGVCCDGCGIIPITGPRYKSKVKYNYDLCQICYEQKGNDSDYHRIDFPAPHLHPWLRRAYSDGRHAQRVTDPFNVNPSAGGRCSRNLLLPRLESCFISDVTIGDGTIMAPKTPFTKIWRMRNSGTLPWPVGVQLVWIGGDRFSDNEIAEVEIPSSGLGVDEELHVAVNFVAPELAGEYISHWRLASPSGQKFGQRIWVLIQVDPSLNDTALENIQTQGADLNIQNPKPEQAGRSDGPLVDLGFDVANMSPSAIEGQQQCNSPGSAPSQWMYGSLHGTHPQPQPLWLQPPQNTTSLLTGPSPLPISASRVSYPTIQVDDLVSTATPSNTMLPTLVSDPAPSYPKNNVPMISSVFNPPGSSSTKNNILHHPTVASGPTSQFGKGDAINGGSTANQGNVVTEEDDNEVEKALVNELVEMGFTDVHLNKEVLRKNNYNLEKSLDELCCGTADWILLNELHVMGFYDDEINRKVLMKNNGSLKHAVMDLISRESA